MMPTISIPLPKNEIEKFCEKHHIVYLALFGSILTLRFTQTSDVDVLVRFEKQHVPHLLSLIAMESELALILGRSVDLKTPHDLSPYFRDDVLAQAVPIYPERFSLDI
mgnify:CR=1 FL=1